MAETAAIFVCQYTCMYVITIGFAAEAAHSLVREVVLVCVVDPAVSRLPVEQDRAAAPEAAELRPRDITYSR